VGKAMDWDNDGRDIDCLRFNAGISPCALRSRGRDSSMAFNISRRLRYLVLRVKGDREVASKVMPEK